MHLDNLLFILLIAVALLFQLLSRAARKASGDHKERTSTTTLPTPPPIPRVRPETDEERIRKFLEALGQPAGSRPPPSVVPRSIPPRPLAPIQPPPLPTARNILLGRKPRRIVEAKKPPVSPVFEVHEAMGPVEAPQPQATTPPATAHVLASRLEPASRDNKADLVSMLRSQSGLRKAILLREIFGPPRSLQPLDLIQIA